MFLIYAGYALALVFLLLALNYRRLLVKSEIYTQGVLVAYQALVNHPPSMLTDSQLMTLARFLQSTQIALQKPEN